MPNPNQLNVLEWRCLGPFRGGRVVAACGHPTDPQTFWFGACAGGVWKTTDAGITWRNVSDGQFNVSAVGAIALAAAGPIAVWWLWQGTNATALYPALLWAIARMARGKRNSLVALALLGVSFLLSGYPATIAYGFYFGAAYTSADSYIGRWGTSWMHHWGLAMGRPRTG